MHTAHSGRLGEAMVERGLISTDQLAVALHEQRHDRQPVGRLLVRLGFISEATLRDVLSARQGQHSIDLASANVEAASLLLIPQELAQRHRLLPLCFDPVRNTLILVMADPQDIVAIDQVRRLLPPLARLDVRVAGPSEIAAAIDRHYGHALSIDGLLGEMEAGRPVAAEAGGDHASHPVVRLVDALLADAVKQGASDIHFEPEAGFLRIRQRVDGILRQVRALHISYWSAMAVRIKVMAGLNIAETRAPQDGRLTIDIDGRPLDLRISVQPTIHGENIVVRILDRHKGLLSLAALELADDHAEALRQLTRCPEGLILITGPTGSGKTTTLYALLASINDEQRCIMTLEDPVEYPMAMIRQTAVAEANKLDFAGGIRAMMRQDPDVLLVGEIRDAETAHMAFRAAMTGHQVYSTLHTRSALGAVPRLLDLGIPPDILAGNIVGVIAQRLVRRLCPHCRQVRPATDDESRQLGCAGETPLIHVAVGCPRCDQRGYRGRLALMEVIRITPELDDLIARRAPAGALADLAAAQGFRRLRDDGRRHVRDGSTTLAELARVVDLSGRP